MHTIYIYIYIYIYSMLCVYVFMYLFCCFQSRGVARRLPPRSLAPGAGARFLVPLISGTAALMPSCLWFKRVCDIYMTHMSNLCDGYMSESGK